jgi:hypothetical protein
MTAQQNDFDAWDAAFTAGTSTVPLVLTVTVSGKPNTTKVKTNASDTASVSAPLVSAPVITVESTSTNVSAGDDVRAGVSGTLAAEALVLACWWLWPLFCHIWISASPILNTTLRTIARIMPGLGDQLTCYVCPPFAGAFVQHSFTIKSSGNVALRGLAVQAPSLSGITCAPPLTADLAVDSNTTCQGVHEVTQDEVETGVSQLSVVVNTVNLVPITRSVSGASSYNKQFQLAPVDLATVPSLSLTFEPTCNVAPSKARKHLICWLAIVPDMCAIACIYCRSSMQQHQARGCWCRSGAACCSILGFRKSSRIKTTRAANKQQLQLTCPDHHFPCAAVFCQQLGWRLAVLCW